LLYSCWPVSFIHVTGLSLLTKLLPIIIAVAGTCANIIYFSRLKQGFRLQAGNFPGFPFLESVKRPAAIPYPGNCHIVEIVIHFIVMAILF
jgi:hypothetical protein